MAETTTTTTTSTHPPPPTSSANPRTGFCEETATFHSLRPPIPLPPPSLPLSFPSFVFSLLPSPLPSHPALLDAASGHCLSFPQLLSRVRSLSSSSSPLRSALFKGDVAFVLSPPSLDIPILYLALLSLGVVVSPVNPASTATEISRLVSLSSPAVAFAVSSTMDKLPPGLPVVLLDSPEFRSLLDFRGVPERDVVEDIRQSDPAAIQYSSGTTGRVKAAALPHRSFIAMTAGFHALRPTGAEHQVGLLGAPMFHSLGFFFALKAVALGETTVVMAGERFGVREMMAAAERHGATQMTTAPPVVVAMARGDEAAAGFDLGKLERVVCGGAPLHVAAAEKFRRRFPRVELLQGYGSTEAGGIARMIGMEECCRLRSVGRLTENVEAKIVDHVTRKALSVGERGELWVRGPAVMIGYVGDDEANASAFDANGWLKTGDLCYFDKDGFLYVVDRLKELIKYKAYQVPPAELEHVLQSLPGVADCAVLAYPDEQAGEIPVALVVRQTGSKITEVDVMDYVAKQVAPYKKIRKVMFVTKLPKSPSGKILRKELKNYMIGSSVSRL
ncbi:4-coumarate--CoA ligase-like 7 [Typha angustifolia]|uniref:4-coumarate--CoA ligase-like 7 n=1 Tax=Typha angustifolia TaxID=59011 RepID=UPI003C2CC2C1